MSTPAERAACYAKGGAFVVALLFLLGLAVTGSAAALSFRVNNESGRSPEKVWVTIHGNKFNVPGMANNVPKKLSEVPDPLTIENLESGRIYISYGDPVTEGETFASQTRFDWVELSVEPEPSDVANLTAVDQVGIGMRLDTFGAGEKQLETVSAANSDTIFNALQQIPGGPQATIRNSSGEIIRVLSPLHSTAYPGLGEYVRSMAGKTITLHTGIFIAPFATSEYSGTFAADGSIQLHGTTNEAGRAPATISFGGQELIEDIYTGANTPNNGEGAIRRDLLAGFSAGFWDGRYGNDAIDFCTNPNTTSQGTWCPNGFNQPPYGDARAGLSPFPTCEQYAAVINQYADEYGNPYSDASGKVTVGLDQPVKGGEVETLQLTILPDSGNAGPVTSGNPNCGAAAPAPAAGGTAASASTEARVKLLKLFEKARFKGARAPVGRVVCAGSCGLVKLIAKKGRKVLGRDQASVKGGKATLTLRLTKLGKRLLARKRRLKATVTVWVTPPGAKTVRRQQAVLLVEKPAGKQRHRQGNLRLQTGQILYPGST